MADLNDHDIAIVGMACEFPGASDYERFWWNLQAGVESVRRLEPEEVESSLDRSIDTSNPNYVNAVSVLEGVENFDASYFGISAREAELMDPQHRIFLQCVVHAFEDAGYDPSSFAGAIGVFAGARTNTYLANIYASNATKGGVGFFEIGLGNDLAFLPTRVSHKLGLRGPSIAVHTACSTSLTAVHLACKSLRMDECGMAIAGGVTVNVPQRIGYVYQKGGILAPDGHCRPFDQQAEGTIFGSGVGALVLKKASKAIEDGDVLHAIIKGSAINNDGDRKAAFTAPSIGGQTDVIREALRDAGVPESSVSYIEAHGTGTQLGDPIEVRALTRAFESSIRSGVQRRIGSVKANIGHLDAAAGIASLIKVVLMLKNRQIPPQINFSASSKKMDMLDGPFVVNTTSSDWVSSDQEPRTAGVSAFGIGGTNAHVIVQEAIVPETQSGEQEWTSIPVSARTETAMGLRLRDLGRVLRHDQNINLPNVAFTLSTGRAQHQYRASIVCRGREDALRKLEILADTSTEAIDQTDRQVAFMFPGQGTLLPESVRRLYTNSDMFRSAFDHASAIASNDMNMNLTEALFSEDRELTTRLLSETAFGQPALFVVEYALARMWIGLGLDPAYMIGHSLGEYVAAQFAGVFQLEQAISLVVERGRLMGNCTGGAMLAVGMTEAQARSVCNGKIALAAVNTPTQCVLSGSAADIAQIAEELRAAHYPTQRLQVAAAFHSPLLASAALEFSEVITSMQLSAPRGRFVSNLTGTWADPAQVVKPEYWVEHMLKPVRFLEGFRCILAEGRPAFLDIGPSASLARFARTEATARSVVFSAFGGSGDGGSPDIVNALEAVGRMWASGAKVDWKRQHMSTPRRRLPLPTYPFEKTRYWIEPPDTRLSNSHTPDLGKHPDPSHWFYMPSWRLDPMPLSMVRGGTVYWIVGDAEGLSMGLAENLRASGHTVVYVGEPSENPDPSLQQINLPSHGREAYRAVVDQADRESVWPDRILDFGAMARERDSALVSTFSAEDYERYLRALYLCQSFADANSTRKVEIIFFSNELTDPLGSKQIRVGHSPLPSLCLVVSQERDNLVARCVDIEFPGEGAEQRKCWAEQLRKELDRSSTRALTALRNGKRWVRSYDPVRIADGGKASRQLREGGTYVITGGLGKLGLMIARHLARSVRANLVLVSRTTLPAMSDWPVLLKAPETSIELREQLEALAEISRSGSELLIVAADVSTAEGATKLVTETLSRFAHLHGVIHAAGITKGDSLYRPFTDFTKRELDLQFAPKIGGTLALEAALASLSVDFVLLMSSNAAVLGGLGYLAYAAANSFMDAFAESRQGKWLSVNWDPWPLDTKTHSAHRTATDRYAMTETESLAAFDLVLSRAAPGQTIVATGNLQARLEAWTLGDEKEQRVHYPRPALTAELVPPQGEIETQLAKIWMELLGVEQVGRHDNFFDLGGHSLLGIRMVGKIREVMGIDFPIAKLFEAPTISEMASFWNHESGQDDDGIRTATLKVLSEIS